MKYSKQRFFNIAWEKITEQGCKALRSDGQRCMYRGANGTKCAVGHFIPDQLYDPSMDTTESYVGDVCKAAKIQIDIEFARQIQAAHDGAVDRDGKFVKNFQTNMRAIAASHKLKVPA